MEVDIIATMARIATDRDLRGDRDGARNIRATIARMVHMREEAREEWADIVETALARV